MFRSLTYANVVSTLALVFAVGGGTAFAASQITSSQIKDGTIQVRDLSKKTRVALKGKTGARGPAGMAGQAGPAGLAGPVGATGTAGAPGPKGDACLASDPACRGPKGDKGDTGSPTAYYTRGASITSPANGNQTVTATCDSGDRATGGGVDLNAPSVQRVATSRPSPIGGIPTGWTVRVDNSSGTSYTAVAYVVCADIT